MLTGGAYLLETVSARIKLCGHFSPLYITATPLFVVLTQLPELVSSVPTTLKYPHECKPIKGL
eukprot:4813859-Prymnesium_polylepis.2